MLFRTRTRNSSLVALARLILVGIFVFAVNYSAQVSRDASLSVRIIDATTGKATPVRVTLSDGEGNRPRVTGAMAVSESAVPIPEAAIPIMYGTWDRAEGYLLQPDGSFYVDGSFETRLPPGTYQVTLSKGYEFAQQTHSLTLKPGQNLSREFRLERWVNMPEQGWYSADDHIHLRRAPKDNKLILGWIAAEDVHVGNLLRMGDFWMDFYPQYAFGKKGRYQEGTYVLSPGQEEPRTPEIGHTISLAAEEFVRFRDDYYSYDRLFDRVHELGGVSGFAHQATLFHGYRGMTLTVLRGKVDFVELVQLCAADGPLVVDHYYQFLDLGFPLTALAGSDFPWCGRGPRYGMEQQVAQIGNARFYTYVGEDFSFDNWLQAVKSGRTFATSGPMLELKVNDRLPGDTLDVESGATVRVSAKAFGHASQIPLEELEIVGHGEVLKKVSASDAGQSARELSIEFEMPVERGLWIAARAKAAHTQEAHTTPVYVTVEGGGFHNPKTAPEYLKLCLQYLRDLEEAVAQPGKNLDDQLARHRRNIERQIAEAQRILKDLTARIG